MAKAIKNNKELVVAGILLLVAAVLRLVFVEVPNIAPVAAMALFAGAYLKNRKLAFILPLVLMLLTDIVLEVLFRTGIRDFPGFYPSMLFVYGSFILVVLMGTGLTHKVKPWNVALAGLGGSTLFFLITNFGVWAMGSGTFYPQTLGGLVQCYVAAIPFYKYTLLGDLAFTGVFFGAYEAITYYTRRLATA